MAVVQISLIDSLITAKKNHIRTSVLWHVRKTSISVGPKRKPRQPLHVPSTHPDYAPHPRGVILEPRNLISHYKRQDRFHPTVLVAGADHLCLLGSKHSPLLLLLIPTMFSHLPLAANTPLSELSASSLQESRGGRWGNCVRAAAASVYQIWMLILSWSSNPILE